MYNVKTKTSQNPELRNLGIRVYEDKMTIKDIAGEKVNEDEKTILDIIAKTFGKGTPSPENLHLFNQFLVETAEIIAEPKVDYILNLLADYSSVSPDTVKMYTVSKTVKPKFLYTAKGTGVDLVRLSGEETRKVAVPQSLTYGGYYEITTFRADPLRAFREAIDNLVVAKVEFYFDKIFEVLKVAKGNGEIPAKNIVSAANVALGDFQKLENTMIRLTGGRPLMVADIAMINALASKVVVAQKELLTDDVRDMLREDLVPSQISKTIAIPFPNTWIDEANSKVRFDVQQAFVFPGGTVGKKPFAITEFGTKRQYSELDPELEQVKLKIVFEADVTLLNGRYLGLLEDTAVLA